MDEEIERLVIGIRADTQGFARDVGDMRATLEGPFGAGIEKAGALLETTLLRAIRTGKLGFEDLKAVALSVLAEIAAAAIRNGLDQILNGGNGGGGGQGGGGLLTALASIATSALGAPGRATGGPVSPGRAFLVGERGPEVFVPTSSGSIAQISGGGSGRDVRISIAVNGPAGAAPDLLARSSRQVARAVRGVLLRED
jgi:phage-related minor tail protein